MVAAWLLALGSWPSAQPASWQYFTKEFVGVHVSIWAVSQNEISLSYLNHHRAVLVRCRVQYEHTIDYLDTIHSQRTGSLIRVLCKAVHSRLSRLLHLYINSRSYTRRTLQFPWLGYLGAVIQLIHSSKFHRGHRALQASFAHTADATP